MTATNQGAARSRQPRPCATRTYAGENPDQTDWVFVRLWAPGLGCLNIIFFACCPRRRPEQRRSLYSPKIDDAALRTHGIKDRFAGNFIFQKPAEHLQEVIGAHESDFALSCVLYDVVREDRGIGLSSLSQWKIPPSVSKQKAFSIAVLCLYKL